MTREQTPRIKIAGNKYSASIAPAGEVVIERYGESWVTVEAGCNAVADMIRELIDARALIKAIEQANNCITTEELLAKHREIGWTE